MGRTFALAEPDPPNQGVAEPFLCGVAGSPAIDVFRLLTGSVDVVRTSDGRLLRPRQNYLTGRRSSGRTTERKLTKGLFGEDVPVSDARAILKKFRGQNVGFFQKLENELVHCIFHLRCKNNVESFLHFYRALEKLAVAFPLMYVTGQPDFERFHTMLKPLFMKEAGGELAFISRFCDYIASESDVLAEYSLRFEFPIKTLEQYEALLSEIKRVVSQNTRDFIVEDDGYFEIPYKNAAVFLIECRNRLFHNSNDGQPNFDVDRIGGASVLCRALVIAGLHWLSLTYVEVVRNRAGFM